MNKSAVLRSVLQAEGLRYTSQREAIYQELCSNNDHRDAEDIYFTLKRRGVSVSRATVYRTIDVLVRHKLARALDIGDGKVRYEHKLNPDHHDHLVCLECGEIIEFIDPEVETRQERIASDHGFVLKHHSHQLYGICPACRRRNH
ncbi:MAG: Fur family transcriptional regulator [Fidelibacterota bacterium]